MIPLPYFLQNGVRPTAPRGTPLYHVQQTEWNEYEFSTWLEAVRSKRLSLLSLDPDVQKKMLHLFADKPDRKMLNP